MFVYDRIAKEVFPYKDNMIVCMESASDFIGLSNGGIYEEDIIVYSNKELELPGFVIKVDRNCFKNKEYMEYLGVYCTTPEQTILDLLENELDIDIQSLLESLSYYYETHKQSFSLLEKKMNERQYKTFMKWKQDAIDYYTEE